jgi:cell division protein FtsI (penicillin-binding protein 3)
LEVKKDILWRVYLIYFFICLFGVAIISRICYIQFAEGGELKARAEKFSTQVFDIEAVRGNIYDANGILLATSLPYFEAGMDVNTEAITDEIFKQNVDSLALCLADLFKDKSYKEYRKILVKARRDHDRWVVLHRDVSYTDLQKMKKFPILNRGKNRGGFVYLQTNKRERPFQSLAARTIGKLNEDGTGKSYGLEKTYDSVLLGTSGQRLMQKIAGNVWRPINSDNEVEPQDGDDIVSTIDINVQDVAETSLANSLKKHGADHGCLVMMEIKTGEVKAIANLKRAHDSTYVENFNFAVVDAEVPGSTIKLASMIALMEDYNMGLNETVDVGDGTCFYSNRKVSDAERPEKSKMTALEVFEHSSNVGMTKLVSRYYAKDPQKFIDRLNKMNLNSPTGLDISGEPTPYFKDTKDKTWSQISLQWICHGYESRITPLQILNFYSAVANNGKMMKPMLVKEIRKRGKTIRTFEPEVINPSICSQETVNKAKKMMEAVVQNGTGRGLKGSSYQIAGKTGTAQMGMVNGKMTYQASFVGYFPADNPKYACIVVVSAPSGDLYYGGSVAGPVFKDVADKVYSTSLEIHKEINAVQPAFALAAPKIKCGSQPEIKNVLSKLKVKTVSGDQDAEWVGNTSHDSVSVALAPRSIEQTLKGGVIPDLTGLAARDVLFLLENNGIRVKLIGSGAVKTQSLAAGTQYKKGTQIIIQLI